MGTKSKYLKRGGLPHTTQHMLQVLHILKDSRRENKPLPLPGVHRRTINALISRDWIVESRKLFTESVFTITGRGEKARRVYEAPPRRRTDGICSQCGEHPLHVYNTGNTAGYCKDCLKKHQSRQYMLKGHQYQSEQLCPDCGVNERHVCSTGFIKPYCHPCLKRRAKDERHRKHKRLLERIEQGEFLPCCRCKVNSRHHSGRVVYDYCYACYRNHQNEYQRRWKLRRAMQKHEVKRL